jgi:predicted nucleic acid-binding protein
MPLDGWIVNASPLILLGKANKLALLGKIGEQIIVPEAVVYEVSAKEDGESMLSFLKDDARFTIQKNIEVPNYLLAWDLGAGETQAIALALKLNPERVVLDDMEARKCAKSFELNVIGTLGLVARAKHLGLIEQARPVFQELADSGMYIDSTLLASILVELGEQ